MLKPNLQADLFKHKLSENGCSPHQASILFGEGLLSFNPEGKKEYEGFEIEELKFLKSLYFDAGISVSVVNSMLGKLERPYSYSFDEIYWDFGSQQWKELPQNVEDYIDDNLKGIVFENFDEFLENVDEEETERLAEIKNATIRRLKTINK